jgi:hypothetical protein
MNCGKPPDERNGPAESSGSGRTEINGGVERLRTNGEVERFRTNALYNPFVVSVTQ